MPQFRRLLSRAITSLFLALAGIAGAYAQFAPQTYTGAVAVTGSASAAALLPTPGPITTFCNTGSNGAFVRLGNSGVVALVGDSFVNAGTCRAFANVSGPYYSIIGAGVTSVNLVAGTCFSGDCGLGGGGGSGGGGGGNVNITQQAGTNIGTPTNFGTAPSNATPALSANVALDTCPGCVGAAALATGQVSCASTDTTLVAARTGVAGTGRASVTVTNAGTTDVWIGNSGLTTATGVLLVGIKGASLTLNTTAAIHCIVSSTAQTVDFVETF